MADVSNWEIARTFIGGFTLLSIYLAYRTYSSNKSKQEEDRQLDRDREILNQAVTSLEWAHETLTDGTSSGPPKADRLNWLTAARHISRYYALKKLVVTETYSLVLSEKEEYWRHRFYMLLDDSTLGNRTYFMNTSDPVWPENIEITSAMVITNFSNWPKKTVDPLNEIERETLIREGQPFSGKCGRGLESYYAALEEAKEHLR